MSDVKRCWTFGFVDDETGEDSTEQVLVVLATDYDALATKYGKLAPVAIELRGERDALAAELAAVKARLADKDILLAQAVEYGDDYKRERDELMVNYQATLARLEEAEEREMNLRCHVCGSVHFVARAADSAGEKP